MKCSTGPDLGSLGEAVRATRCTLGVLSQRLAGGEAKDLASQLPEEIGLYLFQAEAGQGQQFSAEEYLDRVATCEGANKPDSIFHTRVVLEVLREAVSGGQFDHVLDQLPSDFEPLFTAGSEGKMRLKAPRKNSRVSPRRRAVQTPPSKPRKICSASPGAKAAKLQNSQRCSRSVASREVKKLYGTTKIQRSGWHGRSRQESSSQP